MTVTDFAEYRLRMRAGGPSAAQRTYYLTGLTQGVRRGPATIDRDLREQLTTAIRRHHPRALVHDPATTWPAGDTGNTAAFRDLVELATTADVCVALLPTPDSAADVVAELQAAHRGGATVVAITPDPDDFLVRAYATVVLPDVPAFTTWLATEDVEARGA